MSADNYEGTQFKKGNQLWKARKTHGRPRLFETPDDLLNACAEYFQWVEDNPLYEYKAFNFQGEVVQASIPKLRAMTLGGMCVFLGISTESWTNYRSKEEYADFFGVTKEVEQIIYEQKFTGAAAGMLNANIIARDLGLSDKTQVDSSVSVQITSGMNGFYDDLEESDTKDND